MRNPARTSQKDGLRTRVFSTFEDPEIGVETWSELLENGDTNQLSLTWQSLRLWWQTHKGERRLALIVAERDGRKRALAPLFLDSGMVMSLCPVQAVDFVGDVGDPTVLDGILQTACELVPDFAGFRFYHVPDTSRTGKRLLEAARRLGLNGFLEDDQPSPIIDIRGRPKAALATTRKSTPLRRERQLNRIGKLQVKHFRETVDVLAQLEDYFQLHVERWKDTSTPSKFEQAEERRLFQERTRRLGECGWLRFSRLDWNGRPIAVDWGTCYRGHFKYGKPAHAADMERYSPGAVLLRHVILAAIREGAHTFDFGFGDEPYKYRYATGEVRLQTWGLYPS